MLRVALICFLFTFKSDPRDCSVPKPIGEYWNDSTVEDLVNLIREETQKSEEFVLPTNNKEFFIGYEEEKEAIDNGAYDFIIVGAGTSGSTLAYKLSEIEKWNVLLIEAGGNETELSDIPALRSSQTQLYWGYYTAPEERACGRFDGNKCYYLRGKVIGGSGAINGIIHTRGNKADYDSWAAAGNDGWSYEDILPYFKQLESMNVIGDEGYHGKNGPIGVDRPVPQNPLVKNFIEANVALGRKIVDYNGENQIGVARSQYTMINGRAQSGGSVFVRRGQCRNNFNVVERALVTKVLINEKKEAYGVQFVKSGVKYTVQARKEVILSAGTLNTPQILMLSGIGAKEELNSHGIQVIEDLQGVGNNLQDHACAYYLAFTTNSSADTISPELKARMFLAGFGSYTSAGNEGIAFLKINTTNLPETIPDIQLHITPKTCENPEIPNQICVTINLRLLHPKSKGTVKLASSNPIDFPIFKMNLLHEEEDRQQMYEAIEDVFRLVETEPFKRINASFLRPNLTECDEYEFRTRKYWECYMRYEVLACHHSSSTAAMGNGSMSVVNKNLQVYGVKNLRVADCSVMPSITSGNTNAPAFVIGAKAADIITKYYLGEERSKVSLFNSEEHCHSSICINEYCDVSDGSIKKIDKIILHLLVILLIGPFRFLLRL